MSDFFSAVFKRYGILAVFIAVVGAFFIWGIAHYFASSGHEVSVLWGLVKYTKQTSTPNLNSNEDRGNVSSSFVNYDHEERRKKRDAILDLYNEGIAIQQACLKTEGYATLAEDAGKWAQRTVKYLRGTDESFAARFHGASGLTYSHTSVPAYNDKIWNFVNVHLLVLQDILKELHDL